VTTSQLALNMPRDAMRPSDRGLDRTLVSVSCVKPAPGRANSGGKPYRGVVLDDIVWIPRRGTKPVFEAGSPVYTLDADESNIAVRGRSHANTSACALSRLEPLKAMPSLQSVSPTAAWAPMPVTMDCDDRGRA